MVSGFRKDNKSKIEFVKDKKQLVLLLVVILLFIVALLNMFRQMNTNNFSSNNTDMLSGEVPAGQESVSQDVQEIQQKTEELKQELKDLEEDSQMVSTDIQSSEKVLSAKEKTVSIEVDNSTNTINPFLPPEQSANYTSLSSGGLPKLPPKITYPVYVTPPPLYGGGVDSQASQLVGTTVSGIMYDAYSPSAVIKIQGTDYLVKKGDVIKGYKILNISKDSVRIQYGKNIFNGSVGQLLVKSDLDYTKNISNLNSKFGGNDVTIRVKK